MGSISHEDRTRRAVARGMAPGPFDAHEAVRKIQARPKPCQGWFHLVEVPPRNFLAWINVKPAAIDDRQSDCFSTGQRSRAEYANARGDAAPVGPQVNDAFGQM